MRSSFTIRLLLYYSTSRVACTYAVRTSVVVVVVVVGRGSGQVHAGVAYLWFKIHSPYMLSSEVCVCGITVFYIQGCAVGVPLISAL
jgi:hypothetical protein